MRSTTLLLAASLFGLPARGQETPQESSRRTLLDAAFTIATRGDHGRAIQLAEQAGQIRMTPSLRLFLAEEHERAAGDSNGRAHLFDATVSAERCVREATDLPTLNNRARILRECNALLARLEARVGRVRLTIGFVPGDGTEVTLNGRELAQEWWAAEIPVAAGEVSIRVSRRGMVPFQRELTLAAGAHVELRVDLVEERREPVRVVLPRPVAPAEVRDDRAGLRVAGWITLGVGIVAGAVGVTQWVRSSGQLGDARAGSGSDSEAWARYANDLRASRGSAVTVDDVCGRASQDAATSRDALLAQGLCVSNQTAVTTAWAFGLGGLALSAVGATMLILSRHSSRAPRVEVSPIVGGASGGATVLVRF